MDAGKSVNFEERLKGFRYKGLKFIVRKGSVMEEVQCCDISLTRTKRFKSLKIS